MLILRGVVVIISMSEDTDAWIKNPSGAVDRKEQVVQVRAQVMCWDNSTGLWGRSGGGGISNVCLYKMVVGQPIDTSPESYCIQARRINDDNMLLDCPVTKDLDYTVVNNSMLHHWCLGGHKFGLTFQAPSEASLFHDNVLKVLQYLKSCASQTAEGITSPQIKDSHAEVLHVSTRPIEIRERSTPLIHDSLSHWSVESPISNLPFIPEEDHDMVPPPKLIHSTTYGFIKMPKKPRAKSPPASPSQVCEPRLLSLEEPSTSSHRFREHHSLHQLSSLQMQQTPQTVTNEYLPSPHRTTLSNYRYNDPVTRNIFLKNQQDLEEKATLVVDAGANKTLWRRNSFQSANESYVHLTKNDPCGKHDYSYPTLYSVQNPSAGLCRSLSNPRVSSIVAPPISGRKAVKDITTLPSPSGLSIPLPKRSTARHQRRHPRVSITSRSSTSGGLVGLSSSKVRCLYCQEYFTVEELNRGTCKDAPDECLKCIKTATCFCCAEAALYHCAGDDDYENAAIDERRESRNCKKSVVLALVCMFVPCLWCYPVLRTCHRCAVCVGWTGPRHRPV